MKVFALAILLVSICCLEGAVVKRQAEEGQAQVPGLEQFQQFTQSLRQYLPHEYLTQEKLSEMRTQADAIFQKIHDHVKPLTDQLAETANEFISNLQESLKAKAQAQA